MDRKTTVAALEQLRSEHAQSRYRDPEAQARAQRLITELEFQVEHPENSGAEHLRQRIIESVREFEVEHPKLTAAFGQLVSALSGAGI